MYPKGGKMAIFRPIRQLRVSEEIISQLKQSILLGHFKPGDKLPAERDLADEFRVSRVAIREALKGIRKCWILGYPAGGKWRCLRDRSELRKFGQDLLGLVYG